jgi:hypothetical protein
MNLSPRLASRAWIISLVLALGFIAWVQHRRMERVDFVSNLGLTARLQPDASSPTGYAGSRRKLIAPGHNNESYQWIAQTQQMVAEKAWRLRHVDYDNAPVGRAVDTPSPYRWWLAAVAWIDHLVTGHSMGLAIERAALWADPLLQVILLVAGTVVVAVRFGPRAALLLPVAAAVLFPLGGVFLPGAPDDGGLVRLVLGASVLALLASLGPRDQAAPQKGGYVFAGVLGGIAFWLSVNLATMVMLGLLLSGLMVVWWNRRDPAWRQPWRQWGVAGAVTVVAAWLIEFAPAHLDLSQWRLLQIHPLYALLWLGIGECLTRTEALVRADKHTRRKADAAWLVLAVLAIAAVPVAIGLKVPDGFPGKEAFATRLSALGDDMEAANLATWVAHQKSSGAILATFVPLLVLVPALVQLFQRGADRTKKTRTWVLLGPVVVSLVLACSQLSWWNTLDILLLLLAVVAYSGPQAPGLKIWPTLAGLAIAVPGLLVLWPAPLPATGPDEPLERHEQEALIERDCAHWLSQRVGADGAIVLAPPNLTTSLIFHGGLRGLGSPYRENQDGFRASVRIAGATSADEAYALVQQRKLTHILIPSWDDFLNEYARLGADQPEHTLMGMINGWVHPRWLRPVVYYMPTPQGFEDDRLLVFEVTDVQDHATWLSRLTEYFIDMGQLQLATIAAHTLATNYSADLGAQVAKARTELMRHDRPALNQSLETILRGLQDGSAETLAWDRRVSLCLLLAECGRTEQAREQAQRCFDEMSELDLRSVSEPTLFNFLGLCKAYGFKFQDESLLQAAKRLLPPPLQSRL